MSKLQSLALATVIALLLSACGTFSNRGGTTDLVMDAIIFPADSKEHRVLRSYVLLASLAKLGGRSGMNTNEKVGLAANIGRGVNLVSVAFECAYDNPRSPCAFFDERMAELDALILRTAFDVLQPAAERQTSLALTQAFTGKTPFDDLFQVGTDYLKAMNTSAKAIANTSELITSLLTFSFQQYERNHRMGALWRDSIELDLLVMRDSLCRAPGVWENAGYPLINLEDRMAECSRMRTIYNEGYSNFRDWMPAIREMNSRFRLRLVPDQRHFQQVSELFFRACGELGLSPPDKVAECRQYPKEKDGQLISGRLLFGKQASARMLDNMGNRPPLLDAAELRATQLAR